MIKGTLRIKPTKKGQEFKAVYTNSKGKEVEFTINQGAMHFDPSKAKDGDPLELDCAPNGIITRCLIPGNAAAPQIRPQPANKNPGYKTPVSFGSRPQPSSSAIAPLIDATAPYNFIPYEPLAVLPYVESGEAPGQLWSGVLRCSLRALTPLLVAGHQAAGVNGPSHKTFFTVNGRYVIPGSSLKGMLRSLLEVLSFSTMRPMNQKNIFWRNISSVGYRQQFLGAYDSILGGYLIKEGAEYHLIKAQVTAVLSSTKASPGKELVKTGEMKGKKHDYVFTRLNGKSAISGDVVDDFLSQRTPYQLTKWEKYGYDKRIREDGIPVFYMKDGDGNVTALGMCRYFRLKYSGKPIDFVPAKNIDFVQALFGGTQDQGRKGRVSVGAAIVDGQLDKEYITVLGQPHPTCLAHYLIQENVKRSTHGNYGNKRETFILYEDREFRLRGRKWYWHRTVDAPNPPNDNVKVQSKLQPLRAGATAAFEIRLDRVSSLELGALLEALELHEGHAHKLGLGKPLGFGSVRIAVDQAAVCRVGERYASLGTRLEGHSAALDGTMREGLRAAFRTEILHRISIKYPKWKDMKDYDDLPPIKVLRRMMDFNNKPDNVKTKYMELNDFKKLSLLQAPDKIF